VPILSYVKVQGFAETGGNTVTIAGHTTTDKWQASFPSCTVTVLDHGTVTTSTIYSDANGTAKSNPFTAASDGQWSFYGVQGFSYDVQFSGAGFSTVTISDITVP